MPGTPEKRSNGTEISKDLQVEDAQNVQGEEPPVPPREITQTDKLNKRLLVSFLNRLNSQSDNDPESNDKSGDESDNDTSFE